jgi:hypothetical protein
MRKSKFPTSEILIVDGTLQPRIAKSRRYLYQCPLFINEIEGPLSRGCFSLLCSRSQDKFV